MIQPSFHLCAMCAFAGLLFVPLTSQKCYSQESILPSVIVSDHDKYVLNEVESDRIYVRHIYPRYIAGRLPAENPKAIFILGQPGSGKSTLISKKFSNLKNDYAFFDADELREFHPQIARVTVTESYRATKYLWGDAIRWSKKLTSDAIAQRLNVLRQRGALRQNLDAVQMNKFRDNGYRMIVSVIATAFDVSEEGNVERYEEMVRDGQHARMIGREQHASAYESIADGVEWIEQARLADEVVVTNRTGDILYENVLLKGKWQRPPAARFALEWERNREKSSDERHAQCDRLSRIADLMTINGNAESDPTRFRRVTSMLTLACASVESVLKHEITRSPLRVTFPS